MTTADLIRDAREGRTDEQAIVFLAEMVMILRDFASPGLMRAKRGEPASLNLDDHEPA